MDILMLCIFICWGLLVFFFICYAITTKRIIQGQEKEIAALRTEIHRIQNRRMRK
jgi:hypothetical protein